VGGHALPNLVAAMGPLVPVSARPGAREYRDDMSASIEDWWPRLSPMTRDWLVANNGDAVPTSVTEEITRAGGLVATDAWWVGQNGPTGFYLSDEAVDWIEEVANRETPQRQGDS
jgi:hypothetical protein